MLRTPRRHGAEPRAPAAGRLPWSESGRGAAVVAFGAGGFGASFGFGRDSAPGFGGGGGFPGILDRAALLPVLSTAARAGGAQPRQRFRGALRDGLARRDPVSRKPSRAPATYNSGTTGTCHVCAPPLALTGDKK